MSLAGLSIEDLCHGHNDWRNIQEVVRAAFKILYDSSVAQQEKIRHLEAELANRPTLAEIEASHRQIYAVLASKVDTSEFGRGVEEVHRNLALKPNALELRAEIEERFLSVRSDLKAAAARLEASIGQKADATEMRAELDQRPLVADINAALAEKANKESVAAALHKKANRADVAAELEGKAGAVETNAALARKADMDFVQTALSTKASKSELAETVEARSQEVHHAVQRELAQRPTRSDFDLKASVLDVTNWLAAKADRTEVADQLQTATQRLDTEMRARVAELQLGVGQKCDKAEFVEAFTANAARAQRLEGELRATAAELRKTLGEKVDREEYADGAAQQGSKASKLATDVRGNLAELAQTCEEHRRAMDALLEAMRRGQQSTDAEIAKKADKAEMAGALALKADRGAVETELAAKPSVQDLERVLALKADIADVNKALADKADTAELRRYALLATVEDVAKEVSLRASVRDVCTLLDSKPSTAEVNTALAEVNRELDRRVLVDEFTRYTSEQSALNASLAAEQCVGRWIWMTGKTKPGHLVPWNVQSVNTHPDNFVWEKDKATVVVAAPGLYEIAFGFFARKKPAVQLLVNGEPVLSAVNSASYVIHHSSGRLTAVGPHTAGSVTGLTLIDFLALPPRAKITITYNGEEGAEGFLSLRKL